MKKNLNNNSRSELGNKLAEMTYYEALDFIKNGIASTFGFLPKAYSQSFMDLLNKLESDYRKCEEEKNEAIRERDEALAKLNNN